MRLNRRRTRQHVETSAECLSKIWFQQQNATLASENNGLWLGSRQFQTLLAPWGLSNAYLRAIRKRTYVSRRPSFYCSVVKINSQSSEHTHTHTHKHTRSLKLPCALCRATLKDIVFSAKFWGGWWGQVGYKRNLWIQKLHRLFEIWHTELAREARTGRESHLATARLV